MDIIETIKSRYDGLTKKQKKIADYMMENKAAVVDMTCLLYTSDAADEL